LQALVLHHNSNSHSIYPLLLFITHISFKPYLSSSALLLIYPAQPSHYQT
jgi:hypothetical protein